MNLYRGRGGAPVWKEGGGLVRFSKGWKGARSWFRSRSRYSIFSLIFEIYALLCAMKSSLEREREFSYKLLSDTRANKEGYDSRATRHTLSASVSAMCPTITPYEWQIDVAEALALGLDATVIAGTGSGKTLPWAMPLLLEENRDKICLVISPLNELEADHVWRRCTLGTTDLIIPCLGSLFLSEAQNPCRCCESRYMECPREFLTKCTFQMLTICARICSPY